MLLNAYSTLRSPPDPDFPHVLLGRRDHHDPELQGHLEGFVGYVLGTREEMTYTLYSVMRHVQRVQVQFSFEVDERALPQVRAWARRANVLVFWPGGSVRDPDGRVLVSPDAADLDPAAAVPFPTDAEERKARTHAQLGALGLRVPATLPPGPGEDEVVWRTPDEVAARVRGLTVAALLAGARGEGMAPSAEALEERLPGYAAFLSPEEEAFVNEAVPSSEQIVKFSWRYEALSLLLWALGRSEALPFPGEICDVDATIQQADALAASPEAPALLPAPLLLDALDLHFRLHWAVRDARLKGQPAPAGLESGVVLERHYALNWLTHFENAEWDEVDTPT